MKTIRLSVTDVEYAARKAARRNERIARRALKRLKTLTRGERLYNLKTEGDYVGVFATMASFDVRGYADGVEVSVDVRLHPYDEAARDFLWLFQTRALEAKQSTSDALLRNISGKLKRDIGALLDWVSPVGVPLWCGSIHVSDDAFEAERYQLVIAMMRAAESRDDSSAAQ